MNRLSISLILAVLASVFITGWLADRLFSEWAGSSQAPNHALESRGFLLAQLLEQGLLSAEDAPSISRSSISGTSNDTSPGRSSSPDMDEYQEIVELTHLDDLALPDVLHSQLLTGAPLLLESDIKLHWYYRIKDTDKVLSVSHQNIPDNSHTMRLAFTILFYLAVAGLILAWVYPLTRQLHRLGVAAEALGHGDLALRVPTRPSNRLRGLELQFNRMAERLQLLVEDNKLLCHAVSHDLRTPLARLRFGIDTLSESLNEIAPTANTPKALVPKYMERLSSDLTRMEELVSALLEFAKLDQSLQNTPRLRLNINDIAHACCHRYVDAHTIELQTDISETELYIAGNTDFVSMLMCNLIDNALRFAHSQVKVTLRSDNKNIYLDIEDDGNGFDLNNLERLKKPFERDNYPMGKSIEHQGYGLGLALVDRLSQWMQAELIIGKSPSLGGASVCIVMNHWKAVQP